MMNEENNEKGSRKGEIESNRPGENGLKINNDDVNLLEVDRLEAEYQEDLDLNITRSCGQSNNSLINELRGFYMEKQVLNSFPIQNYDACVMVGSDALIL